MLCCFADFTSHTQRSLTTWACLPFSLVLNRLVRVKAAADSPLDRCKSPLHPPKWKMLLSCSGLDRAGRRQQAITWPRQWTPSRRLHWEVRGMDPNWVRLSLGYFRALGIDGSPANWAVNINHFIPQIFGPCRREFRAKGFRFTCTQRNGLNCELFIQRVTQCLA